MKVSTQEIEQSQVVVEIEVEPPRLERAMDQAYRLMAGRLRVPGFRPGKAPRPLVEDLSVHSEGTTLVNANLSARLTRAVRVVLDVFNLRNAPANDIDYYYASRLPGEPADGIEDIHFHPTLPRTVRVSLSVGF